ncbi:MAG: glycosyltransferase [Candidatus Omnitrophota bacterium]|jgi:rhamnosyltransferase
MGNIDVSVVIPVKNGERYLDSALKAVFSQKTNFRFEVIIVDSGSTDRTGDIIKKYPAVKLHKVNERDFNHGLTRNFGISNAGGRYVILMTQDAVPCGKNWMDALIGDIERDSCVAGVYSRQIPHPGAKAFGRLKTSMFFASGEEKRISHIDNLERYNGLPPQEKRRFCSFDNVSSCIRKSVWEAFKFSNSDFGEDIEWAKRVLEAGYKIVYEPDSAVYHSHDYSIAEWYKRNREDCGKLYSLFGLNEVSTGYKVLPFIFIYMFLDFCGLVRLYKYTKDIKTVLSVVPLIPVYAFAGAFGRYMGTR